MRLAPISHEQDKAAGVYRLVFGEVIMVESDILGPTGNPTLKPAVLHPQEIVFADDDDRWFENGERRSDDDVAETQMRIVRASLSAS